jgi:Methylamine utilisation protein MauE
MRVFDWIYKLSRWCIGGIFIYAGSLKLPEPTAFAVLIGAYGVVPESLLTTVAVALPAMEVAAGMGLLFDIRGSLSLIAGLLVLFSAFLGYGIWMGLDVDCGCFGPTDVETKAFHGLGRALYRDLVMLAGIAFAYGWRRYRSLNPVSLKQLMEKLFKKRRAEDAYV